MTATCVYIHVKAGYQERFIEATTANHLEAVKEKGNLRFDLIQQDDDPERFMLYEAYDSEDAAAAHKKTPHYLVWRDAVENMMAEPRKGVKHRIIQPVNIK